MFIRKSTAIFQYVNVNCTAAVYKIINALYIPLRSFFLLYRMLHNSVINYISSCDILLIICTYVFLLYWHCIVYLVTFYFGFVYYITFHSLVFFLLGQLCISMANFYAAG